MAAQQQFKQGELLGGQVQALAGDPTDNVPGVPGIGVKTAAQLILEYGDLETLLAWNAADPVNTFEMRRNDRIHAQWQGNRNPFIDHPEWATAIWN